MIAREGTRLKEGPRERPVALTIAMGRIFERCKLVAEPAAAAPVAALLSGKLDALRGATVVCVLSGGNIGRERLRSLL